MSEGSERDEIYLTCDKDSKKTASEFISFTAVPLKCPTCFSLE